VNKEARVGLFILVAVGILFYLSINIGALNLWSNSYFAYKTYFDDVAGLEQKSPVKISGITVGWVESINLTDKGKAEVTLRINHVHKLFKNSYATITQDNLLGNKILEVDSGESSSGLLPPGSVLHMPGRSSASLSDILEEVKDITNAVQEVAFAFNRVFASSTGEERMKKALDDLGRASDNVANLTVKLNKIVDNNQDKINRLGENLDQGVADFAATMPNVKTMVAQVKDDLPVVTNDLKETTHNAALAAKSAQIIGKRLEQGEGTLGKLISEDDIYQGVKESVDGLKELVGKAKNLEIIVDAHNEQFRRLNNSRGELNITLRFQDDYFYIVQLAADELGKFRHSVTYTDLFYEDGVTPIDRYQHSSGSINGQPAMLSMNGGALASVAPVVRNTLVDRTAVKKGLQVAKRFDRIVLRAGMFDDAFGIACDYDVPLRNTSMRWTTSVEAFDFSGFNRINDDRMHLRWSNKLFVFKNLYTYFGLDDIVSRRSAAPFFGAGVHFNDDDIKFLLYAMMGKSLGD